MYCIQKAMDVNFVQTKIRQGLTLADFVCAREGQTFAKM
jgi:hypothetical protein